MTRQEASQYIEANDRYVWYLVNKFTSLRPDQEGSEDAAQETRLAIYRAALAHDPGRGALSTITFEYGQNALGKYCRVLARHGFVRRRGRSAVPVVVRAPSHMALATGFWDGEPDAESRLDLEADVEWAMSRLSRQHRRVVVMRYVRGISREKAAMLLGVSKHTIRNMERAALDEMRRTLTDYASD